MSEKNQFCDCNVNIDENYLISLLADEIAKSIENKYKNFVKRELPKIPVGVSNRHVHLTEKTFHKLFGEETKFESLRPLYQPGEFASKHTLTIVGSKLRCIENVRILGPLRKYDQVEVSLTDSIYLGIEPPIVNSGSLENAAPLTLVGPKSSIYIERCAIIANRHIHMNSKEAMILGVKDGDLCKVRIQGIKSTIFENVLIRINDNWRLQIHLDTDDANAAFIKGEAYAEFLGKM
ncbi:MAG: phosphate propanoyltransferase [Melioribacter sp.]|uniref:phosphate propanoyltransferase n=1 Tax=Rosettibacter primus TaxID=3111523 RepID=UPI00247DE65F|nr:phosphate propanoyltransferase [Melioribacter sp.]